MIEYAEGYWGVWFAFRLYGSVIPRATVWGVACAAASAGLHYHITHQEAEDPWHADVASEALKGFTFAMGFLLVMRTQKGYTRWWEGGTLLQQVRGEWFNAVSNLMAFCNSDPDQQLKVEKLQHLLVRLFSLLYGNALMQVSTMRDNCFEFLNLEGFDPGEIDQLNSTHDSCELVLQWIQRVIVEASNADTIKIAPPILSRVYNQLGNGIVKLNNARKIRDFPVPFSLAQLVTFMLLVHWLTTAVVCAVTINSTSMAAVVAFTVIAPLWGINYMAVELENPYGDDPNDLPLHAMQRDLNRSLKALLHPSTLRPPSYNYNPELDREMKMEKVDIQTAWHTGFNRAIRVRHCCETSLFGAAKASTADDQFDLLHGGSENETEGEQVYKYGKCADANGLDSSLEEKQGDDTEKIQMVEREIQCTVCHMAGLPDFPELIPCTAGAELSSVRRTSIKGFQGTQHTERCSLAPGERNRQHVTGAHLCLESNSERSSDRKARQLMRTGVLAPLDLTQLQPRLGPEQSSRRSKKCPVRNVQR